MSWQDSFQPDAVSWEASFQPTNVQTNDDPFDPAHAGVLLDADIIRGLLGAGPAIVDMAARTPAWAANIATGRKGTEGDSWTNPQPGQYPPSINAALQNKLTEWGFPEPQNSKERYASSAVRNWPFGVPGMLAGAGNNFLQQNNPQGNENLVIKGRDVGVSPNDLYTAGIATGAQVSPTRYFALKSAPQDAVRLSSVANDYNIPVYPSDIARNGSTAGDLTRFYNSSPFSGASSRRFSQQSALTGAQVGTTGSSATELSAPVMKAASEDIGAAYKDFASRNSITPKAGSSFIDEVSGIIDDPQNFSVDNTRKLNNFVNKNFLTRINQDYSMSGDNWHTLYKEAGRLASSTKDDELAQGYKDIQGAAIKAMSSSVSPEDYQPFLDTNMKWRAQASLEPAIKSTLGTGIPDQGAIWSGVNKYFPNTIYNDPSASSQLAQVGQMLNRGWSSQNQLNSVLHRSPLEIGQILSYGASPLNSKVNYAVTPAELNNPLLMQFYNAGYGLAGASQPSLTQRLQWQ